SASACDSAHKFAHLLASQLCLYDRNASHLDINVVSRRTRPRLCTHAIPPGLHVNASVCNRLDLAPRLLFLLARARRRIMETMLQGLVIIGGLTFSLAASLLIEELIFGQIVRVAFARRPEAPKRAKE